MGIGFDLGHFIEYSQKMEFTDYAVKSSFRVGKLQRLFGNGTFQVSIASRCTYLHEAAGRVHRL